MLLTQYLLDHHNSVAHQASHWLCCGLATEKHHLDPLDCIPQNGLVHLITLAAIWVDKLDDAPAFLRSTDLCFFLNSRQCFLRFSRPASDCKRQTWIIFDLDVWSRDAGQR